MANPLQKMFHRLTEKPVANVSDYARWSQNEELLTDWDSRTKILASFIPLHSSVLEFGAGRMILCQYLPEGCTYTPSDLVDRGPGTIICDLNATPLPDLPPHDIVVFGGVLEYVDNPQRVIRHIKQYCKTVIASYAFVHKKSTLHKRTRNKWINHLTKEQFIELFEKEGLHCSHQQLWRKQILCVFHC